MKQELFYYIGSGFLLSLSGIIAWYVRWSIQKNKSNWQRVFEEPADIKQSHAVLNKDMGFLYGEQKQHSQQLAKKDDRLLTYEMRMTRPETRVEDHLKV